MVVVDEAHNIIDTINNIHSVELSYAQAIQAASLLSSYLQSANSAAVKGGYLDRCAELFERTRQMVSLLNSLAAYLDHKVTRTGSNQSAHSPPKVDRRDSAHVDATLDREGTVLGLACLVNDCCRC